MLSYLTSPWQIRQGKFFAMGGYGKLNRLCFLRFTIALLTEQAIAYSLEKSDRFIASCICSSELSLPQLPGAPSPSAFLTTTIAGYFASSAPPCCGKVSEECVLAMKTTL